MFFLCECIACTEHIGNQGKQSVHVCFLSITCFFHNGKNCKKNVCTRRSVHAVSVEKHANVSVGVYSMRVVCVVCVRCMCCHVLLPACPMVVTVYTGYPSVKIEVGVGSVGRNGTKKSKKIPSYNRWQTGSVWQVPVSKRRFCAFVQDIVYSILSFLPRVFGVCCKHFPSICVAFLRAC